jgi:hypothetical protein
MSPPGLLNLSIGELIAMAGADPWELQQQLLDGRPDQIDDLASEFHKAAGHVGEGDGVFATARAHFSEAYRGANDSDTINESRVVQQARTDFALSAEKLATIARDLEEIASGLADAQNTSRAPIYALDATLRDLDAAAGASELTLTDLLDIKTAASQAIASTAQQVKNGIDAYETLLNARVADIEANGWRPAVDLDDAAPAATIPSDTSDPTVVNKWWTSLSAAEQQRLLAEHPDQIGNLNGVPVADRSAANEAVMHRDIDTVEDAASSHGVSADQVVADPSAFGVTRQEAGRYANARRSNEGLVHDRGHSGVNEVFLYKYRPEDLGGRGAAAIAIGNPDTADNTTVVVPGTGNSVNRGWLSSQDALNVYNQSQQADPNRSTAVVAWMGYQTPDSPTDPRIATPGLARDGASALAADVNGLWASHDSATPSHVTVSGHSYGSTTVADAAVKGMHANDVVLVGCPGTDLADSASDFHLDGGKVYVGDASADPVGQAGEYHYLSRGAGLVFGHGTELGLGADPASAGYGATRFDAQVPGYDGEFDFGAHTHYYQVGNESLHNIVAVATGHGDQLESQGMAAPLRQGAGFNSGGHHFAIPGAPHNYDTEVGRPARTGLEYDSSTPGKHY